MSGVPQHFVAAVPASVPNTKWGRAITGGRNGYQILPDVLVRHQRRLGLTCTDMVVLLNILMHWWESDPQSLPHPRPDQVARRVGVSVRTVQRSIGKMVRDGLIEWLPSERTRKGRTVRRFSLAGLQSQLEAIAQGDDTFEDYAA